MNGFNIQSIMQMMNNPMFKAMMNAKNPQQMAMNMLSQSANANTPMGKQIMSMLQNGDMKAIESYSRNILVGQGINPDELQSMVNKISNGKL